MLDDWTKQINHFHGGELQSMSFRERAAVFFFKDLFHEADAHCLLSIPISVFFSIVDVVLFPEVRGNVTEK